MGNSDKKSSFLKLVVVDGEKITEEDKGLEWYENIQYDMFGSSNTLLYLEVKTLDISDIKDLISKFQVRHILDLRDVPYLNFGRSNRRSFFNFIDKKSVDYLSLISVASKVSKSSINDLLEDDSSFKIWKHELSNWIEHGPTLAFTDNENDSKFKSFTEQLSRSNIDFELMN